MGPGCFHPRNCAVNGFAEDEVRGFNGAGMFPSQKSDGLCCDESTGYASMGPGCFHPRNSHSSIYSIFKDLRASSRAPLHLKPISNSSTILRVANPRPLVTLSARERPPLHRPRPAARARLPRRKHRVFRNLPLQYPRQQPRLNLQQPPVVTLQIIWRRSLHAIWRG